MTKIFYDHIVVREEITTVFDNHKLPADERQELEDLVDQILHHHTLNVVLSHLPREHHHEFISRFQKAPHDPELLQFIQERVGINISAEIKTQADRIKKEILNDIKKSATARTHR